VHPPAVGALAPRSSLTAGGSLAAVQRVVHPVLLWTSRVVGVLAVIAGVLTCAITVVIVMNRELFGGSIEGLEEVAQYAQGWFVAFAAAYATAAGTHFNLVFVLRRATRRHYPVVSEWLADLSGLAVGALLLVSGIRWFPFAAERHSEVLNVSLAWAHSSIAVVGGLIVFFATLRLLAGRDFLASGVIRLAAPDAELTDEDDGAAAAGADVP
jgi:TRAP-type C4-dicarboxylate transport system permease small subunit